MSPSDNLAGPPRITSRLIVPPLCQLANSYMPTRRVAAEAVLAAQTPDIELFTDLRRVSSR
jgi:hypothetical protein